MKNGLIGLSDTFHNTMYNTYPIIFTKQTFVLFFLDIFNIYRQNK